MLQSKLFTKTRREDPKDEQAKNAKLLIRAGFINKEMAGAYDLLPLGLRVVEKIKSIVREEMEKLGSQEILMTSIQRKDVWEKTGRWSDEVVDVWFKSALQVGGEVGFGWSHEEPIGDMMRNYILSFRDLPFSVYQFQTKLRNEVRAKSGIMRGREFMMKDMYSFSLGKEDHDRFYAAAIEAYNKVFARVGIGADTFVTFAAGGAFTKFSHEFQTITEAGEDAIYLNREKNIAINEEVLNDETLASLGVKREDLEKVSTAEVGNVFNFGTEKGEALGLFFKDQSGESIPVWMGSYGIGITRLMGVLVEKFSDEKGIIWPKSVAPFDAHIIVIGGMDSEAMIAANKLTETLEARGVEILLDDREASAGEKFSDADLFGIPTRIVISPKTLEEGKLEVKDRATGEVKKISEEELVSLF
ncbi:MAG: His/Gly/Thr/Pro-type tRNA ligase C-terminal domain-containing protein [Candidatus Vogelbacteria bacterium]|nr:His/Gly/Thr/Pro-type tRNA ligase C-terminal domain-containing protein [Candidatus Vogelbacteria bacterium]